LQTYQNLKNLKKILEKEKNFNLVICQKIVKMSAKRISDFLQFFQIFAHSSSVARIPCVRWQKILLRPHLQKLHSLKWK